MMLLFLMNGGDDDGDDDGDEEAADARPSTIKKQTIQQQKRTMMKINNDDGDNKTGLAYTGRISDGGLRRLVAHGVIMLILTMMGDSRLGGWEMTRSDK